MAKGRVPGGGMITPAQMMQQWKNAPHRFDLNLNNFEVRIGRAAEAIFKKSFEMHRFNPLLRNRGNRGETTSLIQY